ncbi:hypothetical protein TKK_0010441 [Trichogramma kaykai]
MNYCHLDYDYDEHRNHRQNVDNCYTVGELMMNPDRVEAATYCPTTSSWRPEDYYDHSSSTLALAALKYDRSKPLLDTVAQPPPDKHRSIQVTRKCGQ